jgi:ATP-dependent RNA helicase RhlE
MPFSNLGFAPSVLPTLQRALREEGFTAPTDIQTAAIPAILQGRDVLASAQTGSGKTAAFALPMLQHIAQSAPSTPRVTQGLVIVPTRELAVQVGNAINSFAKYLPQRVKVAVVFGGVSINPQMMHLRGGVDMVVATPGRLLDLIDSNALTIAHASTLVLDEADRLLDMGFGDELGRILALLPRKRQNLFFSATFPPAIEALASSMLHNPLRVQVLSAPETEPDITQRAIQVDTPRRTMLLRHLIETHKWTRVLVFAATKHATEIIAVKLRTAGITAEPFHGELSQGKRTQVLMDFKAQKLQVVVATDVAARGIDIAQLPVVVNYDLPRSAVDYTHRIGRTGRAGESGLAVSLVTAAMMAHWKLIEKRQRLSVALEQVAGFEPTEDVPEPIAVSPSSTNNGGVKGLRPSKKDKLRAAAKHSD